MYPAITAENLALTGHACAASDRMDRHISHQLRRHNSLHTFRHCVPHRYRKRYLSKRTGDRSSQNACHFFCRVHYLHDWRMVRPKGTYAPSDDR